MQARQARASTDLHEVSRIVSPNLLGISVPILLNSYRRLARRICARRTVYEGSLERLWFSWAG